MAHAACRRPFAERDFCDEFGLDPMGLAIDRSLRRERALVGRERIELLPQLRQRSRVEAGADVACIAQCTLVVVNTQQERPETSARSLRIGPTTDDELLPLGAFELDPVRRTAGAIDGILALADDAFKAELACGQSDVAARRVELVAETDRVGIDAVDQRLEDATPVFQRHFAQVLSAAERQIENEVDDVFGACLVEGVLQRLEVRHARTAMDDDLTV